MAQAPVGELQSLRGKPLEVSNVTVAEANAKIAAAGLRSESYEIEAELEPGSASEIGFHVLKGDGSQTVVGIAPASNTLFVDRTNSGDVFFSEAFPGRFSTTLHDTKRVKLHIFVDRSIVEVFANDGDKVMTDRAYPPQDSWQIEMYANGGAGKIDFADDLDDEFDLDKRQSNSRNFLTRSSRIATRPSKHGRLT